eukprot:Opistho-2@30818
MAADARTIVNSTLSRPVLLGLIILFTAAVATFAYKGATDGTSGVFVYISPGESGTAPGAAALSDTMAGGSHVYQSFERLVTVLPADTDRPDAPASHAVTLEFSDQDAAEITSTLKSPTLPSPPALDTDAIERCADVVASVATLAAYPCRPMDIDTSLLTIFVVPERRETQYGIVVTAVVQVKNATAAAAAAAAAA